MHTIMISFTIRGWGWHPDEKKINFLAPFNQFSHVQLHVWPFPNHTHFARWTTGKKRRKQPQQQEQKEIEIAHTIKLICANILFCQRNTIYREGERKESVLIFLDLNLTRARTWLFMYITFNTLHVGLRYLLLTFSITEHCINLFQVFLLARPITALPSSRAFCIFSKRSFILEFRESFQVSNSSRQEFSWSSSWSNASYSKAKEEEIQCVIDQARGQDGWLLVKFFFCCCCFNRLRRSRGQ